MLPTFIIAGAGKAGTTTLWSHLNAHPQVCMARIKEPAFFTKTKGINEGGGPSAPTASGAYSNGLRWYQSLFTTNDTHTAYGEASTIYMHAPDAAALIKQHIPDIKLVFILRDPVSRMYSQYWQERKAGMELPSFDQMLDMNHPRISRYAKNSHYRLHIERFLTLFPREQLHILFTEQLSSAPGHTLDVLCNFIGIQTGLRPDTLYKRQNPSALARFPKLQRILRSTAHERLKRKLPALLRNILSSVARKAIQANLKPFTYPMLSPRRREDLIKLFLDDIAFVEQLTETKLDQWRSVP